MEAGLSFGVQGSHSTVNPEPLSRVQGLAFRALRGVGLACREAVNVGSIKVERRTAQKFTEVVRGLYQDLIGFKGWVC